MNVVVSPAAPTGPAGAAATVAFISYTCDPSRIVVSVA